MLGDLVEETCVLFSSEYLPDRDIPLETLINKAVEVEGDPMRLKQALWNLLTNAAEATEDAGVVRVTLESDEESGEAILRVQDSGPGIPHEIKDSIFDPFVSGREDGKGLGLPVVLSIVEAHKGTIETENAPTRGTIFIVRLPLAGGGVSPLEV
jgi:signal transduction histidine kinase